MLCEQVTSNASYLFGKNAQYDHTMTKIMNIHSKLVFNVTLIPLIPILSVSDLTLCDTYTIHTHLQVRNSVAIFCIIKRPILLAN